MKATLTTVAAVLMLASPALAAGDTAALDEKNGFKDYKFETKFNVAKLRPTETVGDIKAYKLGVQKVGATPVDVTVFTYKGLVSNVSLTTKGITNSRAVLETLKEAYGEPSRPNRYMEKYVWYGNRVMLAYDENSITHDASIIFFSKPMNERQEEDEKKAAGKAVDDL